MGKWLLRIAIALAALLLVAALAVYLGGPWAVERYLRRDIAVGGGSLRLSGAEFRWNLDLTADTLQYGSPGLDARAEGVRVSANLFRSLFKFSPSLDLDVADVDLRFKAVDDSLEEKVRKPEEKGPPAFPDFGIPASIKAKAGRLRASGDTADFGSVYGVRLANDGERAVRLRIDSLDLPAGPASARGAPPLRLSLDVSLDWSGREELQGVLEASLGGALAGDGARLALRARKDDLRRAGIDLHTRIASLARYRFLLGESPYVAGAGGWEGDLGARVDLADGLKADLSLDGRFGGLSGKLPVVLSPQRLALRFAFADSAGTWSVKSAGGAGESLDLRGSLAVAPQDTAAPRDSLRNPGWLLRHLAVTLSGTAGGIPVTAAGKTVEAELSVRSARYAPGRAVLEARTGGGSEIAADLRQGPRGWNGTFSAGVAPGEAWLTAFTDTNVAFRRLTVAGSVREGRVRAVTDALYLSAYGLLADTLVAVHRYDARGYVLESGRISRAGAAWDLSGSVELSKRSRPLAFRVDGGPDGSAEVRMPRPDIIEARVRNLAPHRLPYRGLDTLAAYALGVSADFRWDRAAREGSARVDAAGRYNGEAVKASARAAWDRERLEVGGVEADLGGSRASVAGAVRLRGRQFYELKGLGLTDLDSVALSADRFDLARAARLAGPEPAVLAGTLSGRFRYSPDRGFEGAYRVDSLLPAAAADLAVLRELRLRGDGDTLRIFAVTVSQKEPLLNDSLSVILSGVLDSTQFLGFEAKAGPTLALGFRGRMASFRSLEGVATLRGSLDLPGGSGSLRALRLRALVSTPFKDALAGLRVDADTLMGEYVVPGIDTQAFSAPLRIAEGRLVIPDLTLRGRSGSSVRGRVEYALAGARALQAQLAGGGLVVQAGADKALLRDLSVTARLDSAAVAVDARVGLVSFEHVKPPLRAAGDLSRVVVSYRSPLGKAAAPADAGRGQRAREAAPGRPAEPKLAPAVLKVSAVLDTSQVRYRLRSFAALGGVFKRSPRAPRRTERAGRPLQVDIDVQTSGSGNSVETDVLRFGYVGDFSVRGVLPYALVNGRVNGTSGQLGSKKQAYAIRNLEVKWLNAPPEEGTLEVEAAKQLAESCAPAETDSCTVITRLVGTLSNPEFAYDSNCEGAYGSGADMSALLYSVRRGCYSNLSAGGGTGLSYQEQALALLEPLASQYLTRYASRLTSNWIETADISGLGALAQDKGKGAAGDSAAGAASAREAIALEVLSKEFWRLRMRLKAGYQPQDAQEVDPWAYRMGVEWKPPLFRLVDDPEWKRRIKNNVVVEAAVYRDPSQSAELNENPVQRRVGLNYNYDWWGYWWRKGGAPAAGSAPANRASPATGVSPAASGGGAASAEPVPEGDAKSRDPDR